MGVVFALFPVKVLANLGANATLPCRLPSKDSMFFGAIGVRVKWTKVESDEAFNQDVLLSMGFHKKTFGSFKDRVFIVNDHDNEDGSILMTNVATEDAGKYRCELINGMTDVVQEVYLEVQSSLKDGKRTFATRFRPLLGILLAQTFVLSTLADRKTGTGCVFHRVRLPLLLSSCWDCFVLVVTGPRVCGVTSCKRSGGERKAFKTGRK